MLRDPRSADPPPDPETVFDALDDDACRQIVRALDAPMTAAELSDATEIPLSTVYKKLDRLCEAALLSERTEIRPDGRHRSRYVVDFEEFLVRLDDGREFVVRIQRSTEPDDQLLEMWTEVRKET
ncbi:MAG: helix-turn-helix domain-containing protein [Halobacteriota archaeon]